jgi:hypothetical protein
MAKVVFEAYDGKITWISDKAEFTSKDHSDQR